jgi:hypothetical protein
VKRCADSSTSPDGLDGCARRDPATTRATSGRTYWSVNGTVVSRTTGGCSEPVSRSEASAEPILRSRLTANPSLQIVTVGPRPSSVLVPGPLSVAIHAVSAIRTPLRTGLWTRTSSASPTFPIARMPLHHVVEKPIRESRTLRNSFGGPIGRSIRRKASLSPRANIQ